MGMLAAEVTPVCWSQRLGLEAEPDAAAASSAANVASHLQMPGAQVEPAGPASMPSSLPADVLALIAGHR